MNHGPKCLYCDKPIQKQRATTRFGEGRDFPESWKGYGLDKKDDDPPFFCSLRCGMHFGTVLARGGSRIMRDGVRLTRGLRP